MKTENEIREYLDDCKEAVKENLSPNDELVYKGIIEGLECVLTDNLIVTKEEQSKLDKIADFILHQNYPKSANGIFAYSKVYDIDGWFIEFRIKYGRQDDCYNESHLIDKVVRRDVLNQWDGNGLPRFEED